MNVGLRVWNVRFSIKNGEHLSGGFSAKERSHGYLE
jgi:hypothetical protein